jgi:glycosyltransferase involved in cell wall biosynthesis
MGRSVRVLHVVASAERRGAQVFLSDLAGPLERLGSTQRIALLRKAVDPKVRFPVPTKELSPRWDGALRLPVNPSTLRSLAGLVTAWRPDILQAHGGEALKYLVPVGRWRGVPVIYRRIGSAHPVTLSGIRKRAYGSLVRSARLVVAVADALREELIEVFGLSADRVVTIPNGVAIDRVTPKKSRSQVRRDLGVGLTNPVLISVGALTWEKDPFGQLDVMERILAKNPATICLIVGDGPMRRDVEGEIEQRCLKDQVRLLGSRDDIGDLLSSSDVLLFASKSSGMEGMPAVLIEAGMLGLPAASYAISGVPEVVISGQTGLLAPWGDVDGLADLATRLLSDEHARAGMGQAARQWCLETFEIERIAPKYADLFHTLAGVA